MLSINKLGQLRELSDLSSEKSTKKLSKRKSRQKSYQINIKKFRSSSTIKDEMMLTYQPWVIKTYGDQAKTKTITLKKYARILRTLRGEEIASADNSKFRFWVKAKGFYIGKPPGYEAKPADAINGRYSVCDIDDSITPVGNHLNGSVKDPPLYIPNINVKNATGDPVYRKVAVVENFFDIIFNVHVDLEGKAGKHAGQKRTYRTITETYAFLPREAVTRFLLGCIECQKCSRPVSPIPLLPTPSPSPTLHSQTSSQQDNDTSVENTEAIESREELREQNKKTRNSQYDDNNLKKIDRTEAKLKICADKEFLKVCIDKKDQEVSIEKRAMLSRNIDYAMPITTTYLKYMRSLGCKEEEALNFESKHVSFALNQVLHDIISHYFY